MALEGLYIRVTHAGASSGAILLNDVNHGFTREEASRVRRPGPVYVPVNGYVDLALESTVLLSYESGAIRQFVDAGELTVSTVGGTVQVLQYLYDVTVDGGAVATYTLGNIAGDAKALPANVLMLRGWVDVVTAFVGGGTASAGSSADPDGFLLAKAAGALTLDAIVPFDGALVSNAGPTSTKNVTADTVVLDVAGAPFTAGRAIVNVEVIASFD